MRKIYNYTNYGEIKLNLGKLLNDRGLTVYKLSKLAGIKYDIVKDYYYNANTFYSFETLAKICYVLDCDVRDLLEYIKDYSYN